MSKVVQLSNHELSEDMLENIKFMEEQVKQGNITSMCCICLDREGAIGISQYSSDFSHLASLNIGCDMLKSKFMDILFEGTKESKEK